MMKRKDAKLIAKQFMALPLYLQQQLITPYMTPVAAGIGSSDIDYFTTAFVRARQQGRQDELFAAITQAAEAPWNDVNDTLPSIGTAIKIRLGTTPDDMCSGIGGTTSVIDKVMGVPPPGEPWPLVPSPDLPQLYIRFWRRL
jgi:uncharacterized protein YqgV (UPF0045/DUF77 family)